MAHTYTDLLVHVLFSTDKRQPFLDQELRPRLFPYMGGILKRLGSVPLMVNGVEDHVHILCRLSKSLDVSALVRELKRDSSKWIKDENPRLADFYWQNGYAAFSVSESNVEIVKRYIQNQEEHHRKMTFQDELRALLKRHRVEFDERYVWD